MPDDDQELDDEGFDARLHGYSGAGNTGDEEAATAEDRDVLAKSTKRPARSFERRAEKMEETREELGETPRGIARDS